MDKGVKIHREGTPFHRELEGDEILVEELKAKVDVMVTEFLTEHKLRCSGAFTIGDSKGFGTSMIFNALEVEGYSLLLQHITKLSDDIAKKGIELILQRMGEETSLPADPATFN